MVNKLAKIIIAQFTELVEKLSKRCRVEFDKCDFKIVSRHYVDSYIIEIFHKARPCSNSSDIDVVLPTPLITIDFTHVKSDNLNDRCWIAYLKRKASEFLTLLSEERNELIPIVCCPSTKKEHSPKKNECNDTYREEFVLCCENKCKCKENPYNDWGKPCKKSECKKEKCKKSCFSLNEKKYWEVKAKKSLVLEKEDCYEEKPVCPCPKKKKCCEEIKSECYCEEKIDYCDYSDSSEYESSCSCQKKKSECSCQNKKSECSCQKKKSESSCSCQKKKYECECDFESDSDYDSDSECQPECKSDHASDCASECSDSSDSERECECDCQKNQKFIIEKKQKIIKKCEEKSQSSCKCEKKDYVIRLYEHK